MGKLWKTGPSTLKIPQKTAQVWELAEALGTWQLDQHGAILTCQWDAPVCQWAQGFSKNPMGMGQKWSTLWLCQNSY